MTIFMLFLAIRIGFIRNRRSSTASFCGANRSKIWTISRSSRHWMGSPASLETFRGRRGKGMNITAPFKVEAFALATGSDAKGPGSWPGRPTH